MKKIDAVSVEIENEPTTKGGKAVKRFVKILELGKHLKLVVKGRPAGAKFTEGGLCYVKPLRLDKKHSLKKEAVLIKKAGLKKAGSFVFGHSTVGYEGKIDGIDLSECLLAIADHYRNEGKLDELKSIAQSGGAFSVKEKLDLRMEYLARLESPVQITIYTDKSGHLPDDVARQPVIFGENSFTPDEIKTIAHAESARVNDAGNKGK